MQGASEFILCRKAHTLLLHREAHRMYNTFKDGMKAHLEEVSGGGWRGCGE